MTLSMMLTVLSLAVAVLGFLYPMQLGWFVAGLCGWLTLGALLRAPSALTDPGAKARGRRWLASGLAVSPESAAKRAITRRDGSDGRSSKRSNKRRQ